MSLRRNWRMVAGVPVFLSCIWGCQPPLELDGLYAGPHPYYPPKPDAVQHFQVQTDYAGSTAYEIRYAIPFTLGPIFDQPQSGTMAGDGTFTYQSVVAFGGAIDFYGLKGVDDDADGVADRLVGTMDLTPVGVGTVDFEMERYPYFDTYGFADPFVGCWLSMDEPVGTATTCSPAVDTPQCQISHPAAGTFGLEANLDFVNRVSTVSGGTVHVRWMDGAAPKEANLAIPSSGSLPGGGTADVTLVESPPGGSSTVGTVTVTINSAPESSGASAFTFRVGDATGAAGPRVGC